MSDRARKVRERTARLKRPRETETRQGVRNEVYDGESYPQQVVIRSPIGWIYVDGELGIELVSEPGSMSAQRLIEVTDEALTDDETAAEFTRHIKAFGPLITVRPLIGTPPSFMAIDGLVVPPPTDPDNEDLGANLVAMLLLPNGYVTFPIKAPGAEFTDQAAQVSEGSGV